MRIAHVQPVVGGLVAGGVLAATVTGFSMATPATQAAELTSAGATASTAVEQCQPLPLPTPSPSSTPTPTPTPTGSTPTPTPSGSTSGPASPPASTSAPATGTPDPSGSGSTTPSASASATTSSTATPKPTTTSATPAETSGSATLTRTVTPSGQVSLCVAVQAAQSSIQRGQAALWTVTAWAVGGNVPDATISLTAAPASLKPTFSGGCGSHNGTASCDLGALDANSPRRQLQAKVAVAASATTVTSVQLTAKLTAANLPKDPQVSAATTVTAAPAGTATAGGATPGHTSAPPAAGNSAGVGAPVTGTSPLPVGALPGLTGGSPMLSGGGATLSPGGNAAGLFPSVNPSTAPKSGRQATHNGSAQEVANNSALPLSSPVVGAQLAGLIVLAMAFVLVVARLSFRRRSALAQAGQAGKADKAGKAGSAGGDDGGAPKAQ
jgi:hypothetical protein